jgi:transcription antitermination factor NusG
MRPDPKIIASDSLSWVCARTRPGKEFRVADDLQHLGYQTFAPHGVRIYRNARLHGTNSRRGVREVCYPVFGSYVFVGRRDDQWFTRDEHVHIWAILDNAGARTVPAEFIAMASKMWAYGAWDARRKPSPFKVGQSVRVNEGPFLGLAGLVKSLPSELQAIVAFPLFGGLVDTRIDSGILEAV